MVVVACGSTTPTPAGAQPPLPEPATATASPSAPQLGAAPVASPVSVEPETEPTQTVSEPSGLRVLYIREGDLWSWTEAGGKAQLTGTGDMSTARLSHDGQSLAFMRGRTLNNAFVILDEAQNSTFLQMKMFLTRLGFNSKSIVNGDVDDP